MEIIPAILTDVVGELKEKIEILTKQTRGKVRRVQLDVIDGVFASSRTVMPEDLVGVETDLLIDMQLMVQEPIGWVERCVEMGAQRVIGHVEQMEDVAEFVARVRSEGVGVGLGLDIHTPIAALGVMGRDVDVVLLMSVEVGLGGQKFDGNVLKKIEELDSLREEKGLVFTICVDGGVSEENVGQLTWMGVDEVVVGKRLWEGEVEENVERLLARAIE